MLEIAADLDVRTWRRFLRSRWDRWTAKGAGRIRTKNRTALNSRPPSSAAATGPRTGSAVQQRARASGTDRQAAGRSRSPATSGDGRTHHTTWPLLSPYMCLAGKRQVRAAAGDLVSVVETGERRALGVTVEGVAVALVAEPSTFGNGSRASDRACLLRRAARTSARGEDEEAVYLALLPGARPNCGSSRSRPGPPCLVELDWRRGDLHCQYDLGSDGKATVLEMALAAIELGFYYIAVATTPPTCAWSRSRCRGAPPAGRRDRGRQRGPDALWCCEAPRSTSDATASSTSPTTCSRSSTGAAQPARATVRHHRNWHDARYPPHTRTRHG